MFSWLNKFSKTIFAKLLITLIGVSFLGFGLQSVFASITQSNVSKVGDQKISAQEFQTLYINQLNNYARQTGRQLTPLEASSLGIPSQVLVTLQDQAALDQIVEDYNLGLSDKHIAQATLTDPSFTGLTGDFDRDLFARTLANAGFSEADYKISQRSALARNQISEGLFIGAPGGNVAAELATKYTSDQRTVEYFSLSSVNIPTPDAPTDAQILTYLTENQANFRAPEQRSFSYINLTVQSLAEPDLVGDDQVSEYYAERKANFFTPASRITEQVVLNDPAIRTAFEEGLAAGRPWNDIVIEQELSDRILAQTITQSIGDPANDTEKTVFGTAVDSFGFVDLALGKRAVYVVSETPSEQKTLDEVRDLIKQTLAETAARSQLDDALDEIEEMRASGQLLDDIIKQVSLPLVTAKIDSAGQVLEGTLPTDGADRLRTAVLAYAEGGLSSSVNVSSSNTLWFDMADITPERDLTIDEASQTIRLTITALREAKALADTSTQVMTRLNDGEDMSAVATAFGAFSEVSISFGRNGTTTVLSPIVVDAAFNGGEGFIGTVVDNNGSSVFFKILSLDPAGSDAAAPEELAALIENVRSSMQDSLRVQYLTTQKQTFGTSLNQALLGQILALDVGQ